MAGKLPGYTIPSIGDVDMNELCSVGQRCSQGDFACFSEFDRIEENARYKLRKNLVHRRRYSRESEDPQTNQSS